MNRPHLPLSAHKALVRDNKREYGRILLELWVNQVRYSTACRTYVYLPTTGSMALDASLPACRPGLAGWLAIAS